MNRENLKQGEYYFNDTGMSDIVFIYNDINRYFFMHFSRHSIKAHYYLQIIRPNTSGYFKKDVQISCQNLRLATSEEKHWLNECIRLDKFITKEVAMKTFKPEYVKIINFGAYVSGHSKIQAEKGKIYKVSKLCYKKDSIYTYQITVDVTDNKHATYESDHNTFYEVSTKEEYDVQFVVKEPEFVLPSKDASIEEILEYCKKKYPKGTKFKSRNGNICINTGVIYKEFNLIWCLSKIENSEREGRSLLYENGDYVKIVEEPTREVTVELGSRVYSLDEITKALTKEYDKVDVEDILEVIKTIK